MRLSHIIAVSKAPYEIEETTVPEPRAKARMDLLKKRFETVFVCRTFTATKESQWAES